MSIYLLNTVGDADAGVWGVVRGRDLRVSVCRRGVLKPRNTVEGGDESVKDRARGQAQAEGRRRPLALRHFPDTLEVASDIADLSTIHS